MSLLKHLTEPPAREFDCPKYEAIVGSKRCRHYVDGGACALPDEFMCVEWLKRNPRPSPTPPPAPEPLRDLLGEPVPEPAPRSAPGPATPTLASTDATSKPLDRIADVDLASFKKLGVEVKLTVESVGDVWLVPEYTGQDRMEISVDHAATLRLLVDAFPGARVVAFQRLSSTLRPAREESP